MTTSPSPIAPEQRLSPWVAAEVRAELARRGLSVRRFTQQMLGREQRWGARRLGNTADVDITVEELDAMADALGIEAEGILAAAMRARRSARSEGFEPPTFWFGVSRLQLVHSSPAGVSESLTVKSRIRIGRTRHLRAVS